MHATCTDVPLPRDADHHPVASRAASLADRSVLVTGAHGFIGRHLVTHLVSAGAHVHAAVRPGRVRPFRSPAGRPGVTWHEGDLTDTPTTTRIVRNSGAEIVFHLASQVAGHRHPDLVLPMLDNNGRAAVNVMRAAHDLGDCRVVLAGSVEEPHESGEAPCSPYAAAKLAATSYAMLFREQWGLPVTVLRPAMVHGPDQPDENKLIPYAITTMLDGRAPRLSSGTRPVDWVYIDDVCLRRPTTPPSVSSPTSARARPSPSPTRWPGSPRSRVMWGLSSSVPSPTAPATPHGSPTSPLPATCSGGVPRPPSTPA